MYIYIYICFFSSAMTPKLCIVAIYFFPEGCLPKGQSETPQKEVSCTRKVYIKSDIC